MADQIVPQDIVQVAPFEDERAGGKFMIVTAVGTDGRVHGYMPCGCGHLNACFDRHQVALVGRAQWNLKGEINA